MYRCGKGHSEPLQSDKYAGELALLRRACTEFADAGGRTRAISAISASGPKLPCGCAFRHYGPN